MNSPGDRFVPLREMATKKPTPPRDRFIAPRDNDACRFSEYSSRNRAFSPRGKFTHLVTPRFSVRPDWRIRIGFRERDLILGLFTCFFFFFFITESKSHIHIQKNYHRSGVHQNLHTYTESHLQIQNCTFTITNQSAKPTCSEPVLVCWPSCMRMFSDVFSCTYTD